MPTGRGFQHIAGVKLETTLGTPVAVDTKIALISDTFDANYAHIQNQALGGSGAPKKSIQGVRQVPAGLVTYWTYDLIQPLLVAFFGQHDANLAADDDYEMLEVLDGIGLTFAVDKQVSVGEYAGFKPGELIISGSTTDAVRLALNGFAMSRSLSSVINTTATLAALAEYGKEMQFHDLTLRIGDLADALAAGDNVAVQGFNLTINRNLTQDQVNSQTPLEALEDGFRTGTLTLTIPRYISDQFKTWHDAHTVLQAELAFDNGTQPYKKIRLPQLLVTGDPTPTSGAGLVRHTVSLSVHNNEDAANANTDFTFTEEIKIVEEDGA